MNLILNPHWNSNGSFMNLGLSLEQQLVSHKFGVKSSMEHQLVIRELGVTLEQQLVSHELGFKPSLEQLLVIHELNGE